MQSASFLTNSLQESKVSFIGSNGSPFLGSNGSPFLGSSLVCESTEGVYELWGWGENEL